MEDLQKIAMLIDADNTQIGKLDAVIREISTYGRILVKRAYGNWKRDTLKNWEENLKHLAIKAEQQFDYVTGKNATDMALVIDAMDLLHTRLYDTFVLVSSDSDYTPLAIKLRESGVIVIGVGEKKTPESFRNSCDTFVFLENLLSAAAAAKTATAEKSVKPDAQEPTGDVQEIHALLKDAADKYQDADGFVNIGAAGSFLTRAKPDFDSRTYGYSKLTDLLRAYPDKYEIKKSSGNANGGGSTVTYRCISEPAEPKPVRKPRTRKAPAKTPAKSKAK